jgi:hypothetical protein
VAGNVATADATKALIDVGVDAVHHSHRCRCRRSATDCHQ